MTRPMRPPPQSGPPARPPSPGREDDRVDLSEAGSREVLVTTYQVVAARRAGYDSLMWQVPSLGLAAQAFLLTLALGPDTAQVPRLAASFLAGVLALLSMQLMSKHRLHEQLDSKELELLEHKLGIVSLLGFAPHQRTRDRAQRQEAHVGRWTAFPSYRVWMYGLGMFAAVAFGTFVAALLGSSVFT